MFDLAPHRRLPGKEIASVRGEIDNLLNRIFDMDFSFSKRLFGDWEWVPRVDVIEDKGEITVKAEIPGCEADDIDVKLDGRTLTICGDKNQEKEEKEKNFHRVERSYGNFCRVVELPAEVIQEDIDAIYKKGVLKLVFKKARESEAKKIEIKTG